MPDKKPSAVLLYHYQYPDDVISARLFDELGSHLVAHGWDVEAKPSNRGCRDESRAYPLRESALGMQFRRVWRPKFRQASSLGRLMNSSWMILAWSLLGLRRPPPDVVIIGTDPMFAIAAAGVMGRLSPRTAIVHWAHDLHPEAAIAEGIASPDSTAVKAIRATLAAGYRRCRLIADLGPCMRELLSMYQHNASVITCPPWALVEPADVPAADQVVRRELFGDARLGLLYSGNFGRAHSYELLLTLARQLRDQPFAFTFSVRGNRAAELRRAVTADDHNIRFADFASEAELQTRLSAADVHMVSLQESWTGTVVPSKFFGCLAVGRPVLFSGSPRCSLARWIDEHQLGWVLTPDSVLPTAELLRKLASDPADLPARFARCHAVYHREFSRPVTLEKFRRELDKLSAR